MFAVNLFTLPLVYDCSLLRCFLLVVLGVKCMWWMIIRWRKRKQIVDLIEQIPGPPTIPFLGNAIEINVDHEEMFARLTAAAELYNPHEGIIRGWNGSHPYVALYKHDLAEAILNNSTYIDKGSVYKFLEPWLGSGLLTSFGPKWRYRRKIITPAFHFRVLDNFLAIFQSHSDVLVKNLDQHLDHKAFNVFPLITRCTLDIICESAMGQKTNAQNNCDSDYIRAVYEIGNLIQTRQSRFWLHPDICFWMSSLYWPHQRCVKTLHEFSTKVIRQRKEERANIGETATEPRTFLDLLLDVANGGKFDLSDEEIREEVDTFIFEGHDTTSASVSWTLYLLGLDLDVQNKVYGELEDIFHGSHRDITNHDLSQMKYLECCIKEALRLYPSVPMIARNISQNIKIRDYTIPKNTTALIVTYMIHRDPDIFDEPEMFRPERFLSDGPGKRPPYAYIPFSAGPRNCIGQKYAIMEEKVILASVLRHYRIESVDRRENLVMLGELILRPKNGLNLKIYRRN